MGTTILVPKGIVSDDNAEEVVLAPDNLVAIAREGVGLLSPVYMKRTTRENRIE